MKDLGFTYQGISMSSPPLLSFFPAILTTICPARPIFKGIVQTFAHKEWWFYENFVPGPQNLRGVSFFKVFMSFHKKIILNHFGNQFWEIRNRNFENQLIWNFCSGNIVKIELRMFFFCKNIKILMHSIIIFIFDTVATFSTRILGTEISKISVPGK